MRIPTVRDSGPIPSPTPVLMLTFLPYEALLGRFALIANMYTDGSGYTLPRIGNLQSIAEQQNDARANAGMLALYRPVTRKRKRRWMPKLAAVPSIRSP